MILSSPATGQDSSAQAIPSDWSDWPKPGTSGTGSWCPGEMPRQPYEKRSDQENVPAATAQRLIKLTMVLTMV